MGFRSGTKDDEERQSLRKEQGAWSRLLGAGEAVSSVYRLARTTLLFTTRRLILVDQALSGRQVEYLSIPYRSISTFSVEATGAFGLEADLRIWVVGRTAPIERQFTAAADVYEVQGLLAQYASGGGS